MRGGDLGQRGAVNMGGVCVCDSVNCYSLIMMGVKLIQFLLFLFTVVAC